MDLEYDLKFEQMKTYIPFLENMIKRLESTSGKSGSKNPRQAQLDKIRSLRDLLLDKKKRMKMENLLKCEQVLVNLYAKVEQRDTLPGIKPVSEVYPLVTSKSDVDLQSAKSKLKIATQFNKEEETLPEIARRSETEESCTPGSKEPALFQRRPNKAVSPSRSSSVQSKLELSPPRSGPKRNYTRVLVSPEPNPQRWSIGEDTAQKPLFSRRSPRRSPVKHSPSHKKEKKKSSKESKRTKDLNITLNVPQDSLDSLTDGDILSRIINCDDNDVDIATLRDLRSQILGELKQTGATEDISDIIMKSYKTKKKKNIKKRDEVEEGELSDSESEAIESIYGSLVVVDKDKSTSVPIGVKEPTDKENQSRKIQICLVINSDKDQKSNKASKQDTSDFEMFNEIDIAKPTKEDKQNETLKTQKKLQQLNISQKKISTQEVITIDDDDDYRKADSLDTNCDVKMPETVRKDNSDTDNVDKGNNDKGSNDEGVASSMVDLSSNADADKTDTPTEKHKSTASPAFQANFYKPLQSSEALDSESLGEKQTEPKNDSGNKSCTETTTPELTTFHFN